VVRLVAARPGPVWLGDVKLTEAKRNKLDDLIDNADKVKLTIEPVQEDLPYKD